MNKFSAKSYFHLLAIGIIPYYFMAYFDDYIDLFWKSTIINMFSILYAYLLLHLFSMSSYISLKYRDYRFIKYFGIGLLVASLYVIFDIINSKQLFKTAKYADYAIISYLFYLFCFSCFLIGMIYKIQKEDISKDIDTKNE